MDAKISARVELLREMTASARSRLPSDVAPHCWIGSFDENRLVVVTDDPSWCIHLRCHQKEVLKQLREEFGRHWHKIQVRVSREPIGRRRTERAESHRR